mmetsp:Transcript_17080/g.20570  ORF Transcript_17080/g.20570 Transcript_17080/m.20570 type:complete len:348 (-) Transcript_17080:886-1929(-)|eukprot:CAMPEP_0197857442 /NCGR_PEP_ID=MMETSP1438-20131217/30519_1 /TAXON_ID=1461541 /ORGANISM="Pterosperma sp., Strain CCMP1384" /LENGTH=347 /DNA_ID=CAMNT_0043473275 /DNA_START=235 /DNA_END=1278 /DNA_ORIENTATION=-
MDSLRGFLGSSGTGSDIESGKSDGDGASLLSDWKSYAGGSSSDVGQASSSSGSGSGMGAFGVGSLGDFGRSMNSLTAGFKDSLKLSELQNSGGNPAALGAWGQSLATSSLQGAVNISKRVADESMNMSVRVANESVNATTRLANESVNATVRGAKAMETATVRGASAMQSGIKQAGSTVTTGVKDGIASVQQFSHKRLMYFIGLSLAGAFFMILAFVVGLPVIVIFPAKFAICFTLGSILNMCAMAALKGPLQQMQHLMQWERLPFSATYIASMIGTLWASMVIHSYILSIAFCAIQVMALGYYLATYFPGGQAGLKAIVQITVTTMKPFLNMFGKCVGATTKCAMG